MKILFVVAMLISSAASATNWVSVGGPHQLIYDKDSIAKAGAFSDVFIGKDGDFRFRARFDCNSPRLAELTLAGSVKEWTQIPSNRADLLSMRSAVCHNWWEFWKR